ncbi:DUF3231 family protein [Pseudalkalibacillus caeni]|uniref:DUF3231 family protein n=1 Tax=Exobacillus caeni TaxID=2574798 RepID=A0A5R9EWI0_9BACL|nr:DUF3231 family protein [Pseudalkalibacillus caeni]TLS35397.1 DUF3231 family protein [Pseudalkalibacillus caeni]
MINNNDPAIELTANEISNIWAGYLKSSMELRFFEHFLSTTKDKDIKKVVEKMFNFSQKKINELKKIFNKDHLAVPLGFTEKDIRDDAEKVFSDQLILFFCNDLTMLSMITYPSALSDCTRKDIRDYFQMSIEHNIKIQNEITELMLSKGIYLKPPQVSINSELDFVENVSYLNGFFGGSRPVNTAEIANLSRIIQRAQFSKMIFVGFSQLATEKEVKKYFRKGRDELEKVSDALREILDDENIPVSSSSDYKLYDVKMSPFSDKLMMFYVNTCLGMFCFIMISQAMTSCLRTDIIFELNKISKDMQKYYSQGLLLLIKEKWIEQPPQPVNRKI